MPTYDYKCTKCGREFTAEHGMLDEPLKKCKKCGGRLEKLLPKSISLIFKGSGFYLTDYRKPAPKSDDSKGGGPEAKPKEAKMGENTKS